MQSAVYASQPWLSRRNNLVKIETAHHHAAKLILFPSQSYPILLVTLNLLLLSLYLIVHYLLLLLTIIRGNFHVDINDNEESVTTTRQSERAEYQITKQELTKLTLDE